MSVWFYENQHGDIRNFFFPEHLTVHLYKGITGFYLLPRLHISFKALSIKFYRVQSDMNEHLNTVTVLKSDSMLCIRHRSHCTGAGS